MRTLLAPSPGRTACALQLAVMAVAGLLAGVTAKALDESGPHWLGLLLTVSAPWALTVVAIGWWSRHPLDAALRSTAFFVAMTAGYYIWATVVLAFPVALDAAFWGLAAVTACPLASALTCVLRPTRAAPVWLGIVAGAIVHHGALGRWLALADNGDPDVAIVAGLEVVIALILVMLPGRPLRCLAGAATATATWGVLRVADVEAYRLLIEFVGLVN